MLFHRSTLLKIKTNFKIRCLIRLNIETLWLPQAGSRTSLLLMFLKILAKSYMSYHHMNEMITNHHGHIDPEMEAHGETQDVLMSLLSQNKMLGGNVLIFFFANLELG